MPDMLRTSLTGLLSFQKSLATTSHNISNANTPGYSRQRTELQAVEGQAFGNGFFGRGVGIATVAQISNRFVELRLRDATTDAARSETYERLTARVDDLLASEEAGLAPGIQGLFNAVQSLAADPASFASRQLLLSEGDTLVGRFRFLDAEIRRMSQDLNGELQSMVAEVNALSADIARINEDIVTAIGQGGGNPPNDLLDQRRERVKELAQLVSVNAVEQDNGALNIFVGNGQPLVVNSDAQSLTTAPDPQDPELIQVARTLNGNTAIISDAISGGSLGGLLDFRREVLPEIRNELGLVATVLADRFNAQHMRGMDLDGNLGQAFFDVPQPTAIADAFNTGSASLGVTITDATALKASDYRLDYDGATFTLTRKTDGASISAAGGPFVMDGVTITVAGAAAAGDAFLIKPVARGAELIDLQLSDPDRVAAADPVVAESSLPNLGDGAIDQPQTLDPSNPALLDDIDIVFNDPPTTYDIVDVGSGSTLSAGVPYVEGAAIVLNGWRTRITGDPLAGDRFRVEANVGGVGDNRNALALGGLQTANLVGGKSTVEEGYSALVARAGVSARQAQFNAEASARLRDDAENRREEISGVNLDEEAIDLTRYQQAYQAMARVIDTSNILFDSLLTAIQ